MYLKLVGICLKRLGFKKKRLGVIFLKTARITCYKVPLTVC